MSRVLAQVLVVGMIVASCGGDGEADRRVAELESQLEAARARIEELEVLADRSGDVIEVTVYRALRFMAAGTPGEEAAQSIFESTALVENVVFAGSTILCTGPVYDGDPTICIDNPANLGEVLSGGVSRGPISAGQLITAEMFQSPGS